MSHSIFSWSKTRLIIPPFQGTFLLLTVFFRLPLGVKRIQPTVNSGPSSTIPSFMKTSFQTTRFFMEQALIQRYCITFFRSTTSAGQVNTAWENWTGRVPNHSSKKKKSEFSSNNVSSGSDSGCLRGRMPKEWLETARKSTRYQQLVSSSDRERHASSATSTVSAKFLECSPREMWAERKTGRLGKTPLPRLCRQHRSFVSYPTNRSSSSRNGFTKCGRLNYSGAVVWNCSEAWQCDIFHSKPALISEPKWKGTSTQTTRHD